MTTTPAAGPAIGEVAPASGARAARDGRLARREQARQALIDAAHAELEKRPWPDVTVDDLARAASLSRTAFYQHFTDRQQLLLELLAARATEFAQIGNPWTTGGADPVSELETTLADIVELFVEHGRLLQAVRDASVTDPAVSDAWIVLVEGLIAITVDAISRDHRNGHATVTDAEQMARALTRLDEAYLLDSFGRHPLADPQAVTVTLTRIWLSALFADLPTRTAPTAP